MSDESLKQEKLFIFILAAVQFAHMVDFVVMMPLGPVLMKDLSITPAQFGALVSSYNFSAGIAGFLFGTIADQFERKKLLSISMLGFITGTFLCGISELYFTLIMGRILAGIFGGVLNVLVFTMATDLVPFERRGKAMGVLMGAFSVASVIGVPLGLWIADYWGWNSTFRFIAFFSIFIIAASFLYLPLFPAKGLKLRWTTIIKNYLGLLKKADYLYSYLLIFLVAVSMFVLIPFLSPYAVKNIGIQATDLKYMYLVGGLSTVFTARLIGKSTDKHGAKKVFSHVVFGSLLPVALFTNAGHMNLFFYILMSTLFMTIVSGRMIPCMTMISEVPSQSERGSFMGLLNSIRSMGSAIATITAGFIISESADGSLIHFNTVGYISMIIAIITVFMTKRLRLHNKNLA
ncbi:MAG: MFS transporter [Bdellovibrio sp.]